MIPGKKTEKNLQIVLISYPISQRAGINTNFKQGKEKEKRDLRVLLNI